MFLRATTRKKDGKEHRYWSIVENRRLSDGRVIQRHVLYLRRSTPRRSGRGVDRLKYSKTAQRHRRRSLFPEDRCEGVVPDGAVVRLRLSELRLCRPPAMGGCWLALWLWQALRLDEFWAERLLPSRTGTRWDQVLFVLVAYSIIINKIEQSTLPTGPCDVAIGVLYHVSILALAEGIPALGLWDGTYYRNDSRAVRVVRPTRVGRTGGRTGRAEPGGPAHETGGAGRCAQARTCGEVAGDGAALRWDRCYALSLLRPQRA